MAFNNSAQRPSLHATRPIDVTRPLSSIISVARPLCCTTWISNSTQQSTGSSTSISGAELNDQHLSPSEEASPIRVFLPNGRQFQIQVVVRRGGQPEWSFSGMGDLPPPYKTGVLQGSSSSGSTVKDPAAQDTAQLDSDKSLWGYSEQQQSAAMQAAAKSLAAIFNPLADSPAAAADTNHRGVGLLSLAEEEQQEEEEEEEQLPWSLSEPTAAAAEAASTLQQQQQHSLQYLDLQQQLLHYQQQDEQLLQPVSPDQRQRQQQQQQHKQQQQQEQGVEWWRQAQTPTILLQRINAAVHPWQVAQVVTSHYDKFTAEVTSAALVRLERLAPFRFIEALTNNRTAPADQPVITNNNSRNDNRNDAMYNSDDIPKQTRSEKRASAVALYQSVMGLDKNWQPLQQQHAASSNDSSSSSRAFASQQQQQWRSKREWQGPLHDSIQDQIGNDLTAAAALRQFRSSSSSSSSSTHARRLSEHLKPLVRGYLRCISLLITHSSDVSADALVAASRFAARLVGGQCAVHNWWAQANGFAVLGEAALRFKDGTLLMRNAVEIAYSYHHCGYTPTLLLQEVLEALKPQPGMLEVLSARELCHMTYCITSDPKLQYSPKTLTTAVLHHLQNPDTSTNARPYDIVMVLRHLCQLNPCPPEGIEQGLMLAVISKMPQMSMQELSTVLHVAVEWDLECKQRLAETVAELVAAAAGLPYSEQQQQQQGLPVIPHVLLDRQQQLQQQLAQALQQQRQQQQQHQRNATATAAAAVADHFVLQQQSEAVQQHIATWYASPYANQRQPAAAAAAIGNPLQQWQQQQQPVTAADPVFLLHRFCQCGYLAPKSLLHYLLRAVGPRLHKISLLQAGLLTRALVMQWEDPQGCQELLTAGLTPWMAVGPQVTPSGTSGYTNGTQRPPSETAGDTCEDQGGTAGDSGRQAVVSRRVLHLPYWQLKGLIVAAGRLGPLASEMAAAAAGTGVTSGPRWVKNSSALRCKQQQLQQQRQAGSGSGAVQGSSCIAVTPSSSSSSSVTQQQQQQQQQCQAGLDGGRAVAVGFVSGLLDLLKQPPNSSSSGSSSSSSSSSSTSQHSSTQLHEWRADMVLALFWACARLGLNPAPPVLQAGTAALAARMHRQVSHHEIVHVVWAAAVLGIQDSAFLEQLCSCLCKYAHKLHPKSVATAAWALAQLRCPQTTALAALSKSLLSSEGINHSHQEARQRCWARKQQQQQRGMALGSSSSSEAGSSSSEAGSSSSSPFVQGSYYFRNRIKPVPTWQGWEPISSSSSSGQQCYPKSAALLAKHPRITLLNSEHVVKLACSCVKAGWAPPHLLLVLAVQAVQVMDTMRPADLAQLLWAYAAANCCLPHLTHAAAARVADLASVGAFCSRRQAAAVLSCFDALGLSQSLAHVGLAAEMQRLRKLEEQQQQQQQQH